MKKIALFLLTLMIILSISACKEAENAQNTVSFYYRAAQLDYSVSGSTIIAENRNADDFSSWEEALSVYLAGPVGTNATNPFPSNLRLVSATMDGNNLLLTFSDELGELSGLDLTIASCCIAKTAMALTDATSVSISAESALLGGEKMITLDEDAMSLLDVTQQGKSE